ncbi:MAG TPA: tyrosine-type recombinase/integrase [Candidatus Angelobacter sp.]|nr:tyrosine-type recombinase/integrase [Candidatus Angelobacter sp.]
MALYRPTYRDQKTGEKKKSQIWWMQFHFQGSLIQESTKTRSLTIARKVQTKRKYELETGLTGIRKPDAPRLLSFAAQAYLEAKKTSLAASSLTIENTNLDLHLLPVLGKKLVSDITAEDISQYQKRRLGEGASPATINLEIGTLRAILKKHGQWARVQPNVRMLPVRDDVGRAITVDEERALLQACSLSRSRCLLPFVTLALETGARFNVIRTLQWGNVDFQNRCLKFGKDKTKAGTGRVVPLSPRAMATLQFWASEFPDRKPEHFVFPTQKYGGGGKKDHFGFTEGMSYDLDVTRPVGDVKEAWERARVRATEILTEGSDDDNENEIQPLVCRFHDLRHTAVSRMIDAGVPLMKIAKIVGWSPSTTVQMAARYGHFTLDELRGAVETISARQQTQDFQKGADDGKRTATTALLPEEC